MPTVSAPKLLVFSAGAAAISNTDFTRFGVGAISGDSTTDPVPSQCFLGGLELQLTGISAGLASIDVKISYDSAGDVLMTPVVTTTITKGQTTATKASAFYSLDMGVVLPPSYMDLGVLHVWVKCHEAGSSATTCQPRLYGGL